MGNWGYGLTFAKSLRWAAFAVLVVGTAGIAIAKSPPPLGDPVSLNIGLSCQWQQRCISHQTKAMKKALKFVQKKQPPSWRIEMCNRNAARKRTRVDWIGFNNCVRNAELRPAPPRPAPRRVKRVSRTQTASRALGERG